MLKAVAILEISSRSNKFFQHLKQFVQSLELINTAMHYVDDKNKQCICTFSWEFFIQGKTIYRGFTHLRNVCFCCISFIF